MTFDDIKDTASMRRRARKVYKDNFGKLFLISLIVTGLGLLLGALTGNFSQTKPATSVSLIVTLIQFFFLIPLQIGMERCYMKAFKDGDFEFKELIRPFKSKYWRNLGSNLFVALIAFAITIVVVPIYFIISLGAGKNILTAFFAIAILCVFLIIIVVFAFSIFLLDYFLADEEYDYLSAWEAVSLCMEKSKGFKLSIFGLALYYTFIMLLIILPIALLAMFTLPAIGVFIAYGIEMLVSLLISPLIGMGFSGFYYRVKSR